MKKILIGLLLVMSLTCFAFATEVDQSYIFTPDELATWGFVGATTSVEDGYLSIVPNSNIVYANSPQLNLEAQYIEKLNVEIEIFSKDGSNVTGAMPLYLILDQDTGANQDHCVGTWAQSVNGKKEYQYNISGQSYWADTTTVKSVRWDPTYSGNNVSEIRVYNFYFTPGKIVQPEPEYIVDPAYIFTPEELKTWNFSGATTSVKDGYLSVVPNASTNNVLAYSTALELEAEYIENLFIDIEIITKDGATVTGSMPLYMIIDEDTGANQAHCVGTWANSDNGRKEYQYKISSQSYWADTEVLHSVRWDATYSGTNIEEIRVYNYYFSPGKMIEAPTPDVPEEPEEPEVPDEPEQTNVNLTIYYDESKTVSKNEEVLSLSDYILPSYYDLAQYTPVGKIPLGFEIDGTIYAPGKKIKIPSVENLELCVVYGNPEHPEYGELVFFENFEAFDADTQICNSTTGVVSPVSVSYINPAWSGNKNHFKIQNGDAKYGLVVADENDPNHVLKVSKINSSTRWPNFYIVNQDTSSIPDGHYTLCADFTVPESEKANIYDFSLRFYYNGTQYISITAGKPDANGKVHAYFDLPVAQGTDITMLNKMQLYATTDAAKEDTYFYIDNISLYYKKAHANIVLSDSTTDKIFYIPGDTITLPDKYQIANHIPAAYELSGFEMGGNLYSPASNYITKATDNSITFTAVYEKTEFALKFKTANANGTIAEIALYDGDVVTLPENGVYHPTLTLCGWKLGDTVYNAGDEFTFNYEDVKEYLDGTARLVFTPVFEGTDTTKYGFATEIDIAQADEITLATLVDVADKLYYGVRRVASKNSTTQEKLSDMVAKGVVAEYSDLTAVATYEDAADMLANVLPEKFYQELCFNVDVNSTPEALKLVRAGIFDESVDFDSEISYDEFALAVSKLVNKENRSVENKRTVYVLGDSLTDLSMEGWPKNLDKYLTGNLDIVNYGIGGINTGTYLTRTSVNAFGKYATMMKNINYGDYVIIALGTNDSTLWGQGSMTKTQSRDNYYRLITEVRAQGGIPFLVCPVGRNRTDDVGNYIESDPDIIVCMNSVNEYYGVNVPIINFKSISLDRMSNMTAEQRAEIYTDDVHYKPYGSLVVAGWFSELVLASGNIQIEAFANHFIKEDDCVVAPVEIMLGQKQDASNVRFVEIDGNQYELMDDNGTYTVYPEKDMLIEVVEKTKATDVEIVLSKYYYVDSETLSYKELSLDSFLRTEKARSIRTDDPMGIRFRSKVSNAAKYETQEYQVEEYGFIIAVQSALDKEGAQLNFDFSKYVSAAAFNKEQGLDTIYDNSNDEWCVITGVLYNIPKSQYKTVLTAKTYAKVNIDGQTFITYSEPISASVYEVAKALLATNIQDAQLKAYLLNIVSTVEKDIYIDIGGLYR